MLIRLYARRRYSRFSFGNDNPCNDVRQQSGAGAQEHEQPHYPYDGHVQIEVVGEGPANARDLAIRTPLRRAHQPPFSSRHPHSLSAIGTKVSVVLNCLTAGIAVHNLSPSRDTITLAKGFPSLCRNSATVLSPMKLHCLRRGRAPRFLCARRAGSAHKAASPEYATRSIQWHGPEQLRRRSRSL